MNKKVIIIIILVILIILGSLGLIFKDRFASFLKPTLSPLGNQELVKKPEEEFNFEWTEWQDSAGFAFEYPKELDINPHPEDEENYAYLELTKNDKNGRTIIVVNDSEYTDVGEWLEKDELVRDGNGLETEIASVSARRVALKNKREIAAFVDWDQVIYTIDNQGEGEEYWRQVYTGILSSFKLIPLEGESEEDFVNWLGGFDTSGVDIIEAVEIIE